MLREVPEGVANDSAATGHAGGLKPRGWDGEARSSGPNRASARLSGLANISRVA